MSTRSSKTSTAASKIVLSPSAKLKKISTTPVTPEKNNDKQVFRSLKKPAKTKISGDNKVTYYDDIMTASFNEFIVATVVKRNGKPGFVYPLVKAIYESNEDIQSGRPNNGLGKALADRTKFDCRIQNFLYLRTSRECNDQINLNVPNKSLYQLGIISCPDKGLVVNGELVKSVDDLHPQIYYEELFRNEVEAVLLAGTKKIGGKKDVVTGYSP